MLSSVHWNETCAKQIFELEKKIERINLENIIDQERLLGEISCLKKNIQVLQQENERLKVSHFMCDEDKL